MSDEIIYFKYLARRMVSFKINRRVTKFQIDF